MMLGNKPEQNVPKVEGKLYWWFSIGRNGYGRFFTDGWRCFEFVVLRYTDRHPGEALPYIIKISFAYWLPFYLL